MQHGCPGALHCTRNSYSLRSDLDDPLNECTRRLYRFADIYEIELTHFTGLLGTKILMMTMMILPLPDRGNVFSRPWVSQGINFRAPGPCLSESVRDILRFTEVHKFRFLLHASSVRQDEKSRRARLNCWVSPSYFKVSVLSGLKVRIWMAERPHILSKRSRSWSPTVR